MRKSVVFILALLSSVTSAFACGFYLDEEDIRFCFFHAHVDSYPGYKPFNYTTSYYYSGPPLNYVDQEYGYPNASLWAAYCKHAVSVESVHDAVYSLAVKDIHPRSANEMIRYLYKKKDQQALNYLHFAKNVEVFNTYFEDPWERNESAISAKRQLWIDAAIKRAGEATNEEIKTRYYFLAIRMAYYNSDTETVNRLFDTHIAGMKTKNIIYYWSMYFRLLREKDPALQYYYSALVFANAADKRQRVNLPHVYGETYDKVLGMAKNGVEKANILEFVAMRKVDHALDDLKAIYASNPKSEALPFLVMREVNKIEDWVLTPYYSNFEPSIRIYSESPESEEERNNVAVVLERSEADRKYAAKLLEFVKRSDIGLARDREMLETAKAYLSFLTRDYGGCLSIINRLEKSNPQDEQFSQQRECIRALALVASQPKEKAVIPEAVKPFLMGRFAAQNPKVIFGIGRELEYLGNTTDAALLYSAAQGITWQSRSLKGWYYHNLYFDYFDYLDGVYTPEQLTKVIAAIETNTATDDFSTWKLSKVKTSVPQLYELLGKKYVRVHRLEDALAVFRKFEKMVPGAETDLDGNPFYEIPYTPQFIERRDSIPMTQAGVIEKLLEFTAKSRNEKNPDRDYYSFLVATCYLNMNYHGNAYTLRRNWRSIHEAGAEMPDEPEYHGNLLARQYYLQAMKQAKSREFRMLCLRMATRCEKFRLNYIYENQPYSSQSKMDYDSLLSGNRYYKRLARNYSDLDYENCAYFPRYFASRKKKR